jgi:deoxycytidine triphosphate deaminase
VLGGRRYAPTFAARSSVARLGLFIHCSGGLGDVGYVGQWTLQLVAEVPIRVRPGMRIGQMSWWVAEGATLRRVESLMQEVAALMAQAPGKKPARR